MDSSELVNEESSMVVRMQAEAIARVLLLNVPRAMTLDEATATLARAEKSAAYACGFIDLDAATEYKETLRKYILGLGVVVADEGGRLTLTTAGHLYAKVPLPPEIESCL